jgi:hypothetical protein
MTNRSLSFVDELYFSGDLNATVCAVRTRPLGIHPLAQRFVLTTRQVYRMTVLLRPNLEARYGADFGGE